ncbi:MAG: flippase-like domain-containing protein [Alphaproteobacteria bacterium]|nr:flippase-like domain-containing protein [Alphaproteobacteria bacterium]
MNITKFRLLLKYAVSLILLGFLLRHMDMHVLIERSADLDLWLFGPATALIVLQILFLNMRWHSFLNVGRHNIPFKISSLINISGYLANILFIASIGGIIAKSGLAIRHGLSLTQAVFATFLDRFMTLAALIVLSALGLPFLIHTMDNRLIIMLALTVSGVIGAVAFALLLLRSGLFKDYILSNRKRSRLIAILRNYTENYDLMLKTGLLSIVAQLCFILCVYVLSLGVEGATQNGHTMEFLALIPVLALISSLPISFGGWGVREGAFIYGLALIGFPMESAFLLSVQVGLVTLIAPFLVGLPYLVRSDLRAFLLGKKRLSA